MNIDAIDLKRELYSRSLIDFIEYTEPKYEAKWFHRNVCERVEKWHNGEGKSKLMIFMPPQHGKSQISTRHTPAWLLGKHPELKIGVAAYNGTVSSKFNRDVQRIMEEKDYQELFPDVRLPNIKGFGRDTYVRNNHEFEIVHKGGSLVSVGVGGGLTSRQIDVMIIDDVYKDAKEAWSPIQRDTVSEWYSTVVESRLHNESKVLIVFTRWHEKDLGGELLASQKDEWDVVKYEAIKTKTEIEGDPREVGEPLWPERHSLERLLDIKKRKPTTFENLYQQDPQPAKGLLYQDDFKTYNVDDLKKMMDEEPSEVRGYVDTADTGTDYLCSIIYTTRGDLHYILDILYTQKGVTVTEPLLAAQIVSNEVRRIDIEGNAGGTIFAKSVERATKELEYRDCIFKTFHQSKNKESRIYSTAGLVNDRIVFPDDWHIKHSAFHHDVTRFEQNYKKNKYRDAPDALTGVIEKAGSGHGQYAYGM